MTTAVIIAMLRDSVLSQIRRTKNDQFWVLSLPIAAARKRLASITLMF